MSDLEIGQRVNPAPVCATPRVAQDVSRAHINEALRVLDLAVTKLREVGRGLAHMRDHGSGGTYARAHTRQVRELCNLIDELTIKAEQV